ncbi:MAG: alpha/beta fold hydrolase [Pyrinomonadaceae bacterium]
MQLSTKYAQISTNITLPYVERGDPNGVPLILLHGVTDSHRSFDLVFEYLPSSIRAIAVTQRGHGDASRPANGYGSRDLANDLASFMDALGIESAIIAGHSMGSFAAQRFAIEQPERVSKLVLIGSFTTCGDKPGIIDFVANEINSLEDPINREFAKGFQMSTIANPVAPEFFEMAVDESLKVPAFVWKAACQSMIVNDHIDELRKIKAPTLLLWGDRDAYFDRSEQNKLLENIERSELKVYPGAGHAPHWEVPNKVGRDIAEFVTENIDKTAVHAAF